MAHLQGAVLGNIAVLDQVAGLHFAVALMGAVRRQRTERAGGEVHVSLLDISVFLQAALVGRASAAGSQPDAAAAEATLPVTVEASDGMLALLLARSTRENALRAVLGVEPVEVDGPIITGDAVNPEVVLSPAVAEQLRTATREVWASRLMQVGIDTLIVRDFDETVGHGGPIADRLESIVTEGGEHLRIPRLPYDIDPPGPHVSRPAPSPGSSTADALGAIGVDHDTLVRLAEAGVIGAPGLR
jgi:crotonobetainyl-CoA:carnitine CoA-transferase CaiB-like acyl-CoA transferase